MKHKIYLKLKTREEAQKILFEKFSQSPLKMEEVPLAQAQGRTLSTAAVAKISSPAFHGAAMDGVAVRAEDTFGATERRPKS
ncbi:MAG: molybdopterin biosynthesis protein, partial [Candidatus Adiutrix sp.]